jgi:molybdenum cofactor cytidylyltransferase
MTAETAQYECGCVILAAGASRRLGSPKQLLRLSGETLLHRAARLSLESGFLPVCVVLGSDAGRMRGELEGLNVLLVENNAWETGMSSSLRAGATRLLEERHCLHHLLVMVCDQPMLTASMLERLRDVSAANCDMIVAADYDGKRGVPAIFPETFFTSLLATKGDRGARAVIEQARERVVAVDFPEGAQDIDTPEDARRSGLA